MSDDCADKLKRTDKPFGLTGLKVSADAILADLARLDQLRRQHEQNKQALVGTGPLSDVAFFDWLHAQYGSQVDIEEHAELHAWHDTAGQLDEADQLLRERIRCWHQVVITNVIALFPSLCGVPGSNPFQEEDFSNWVERHASPQAAQAGRLVLSIWHREPERFHFADAFVTWDDDHRRAFVDWLKRPVMPQREIWGELW